MSRKYKGWMISAVGTSWYVHLPEGFRPKSYGWYLDRLCCTSLAEAKTVISGEVS